MKLTGISKTLVLEIYLKDKTSELWLNLHMMNHQDIACKLNLKPLNGIHQLDKE